jgi:hypothetical protein
MGYRQDDVQGDERAGYTATYYPGTANLSEARRLTLSVGQTLNDLSMTLVTIQTARVIGVVMDSQGRPMSIGIVTAAPRNSFGLAPPAASAVKPDGSFQLSGLAPGDYILTAFTTGGPAEESATASITISGQDVTGLQLLAAKPSTLSGRILTAETASTPPLQLSQVLINASPKEPLLAMSGMPAPARANEDGTFAIKSRPGNTRITAFSFGSAWRLKAVRLNGVDVTDTGFDVKPNEDLAGFEVELTNRVTMLTGAVSNSRGEPS